MRIAYLTSFNVDEPSGMALRVRGIAAALALAGDEVTVISPTAASRVGTVASAASDASSEAPWISVGFGAAQGIVKRVIARLLGIDAMGDYCRDGGFDRLLVYGLSFGLLRQARRARFAPGTIAFDIVDWFDSSHFRGIGGWFFLAEHQALFRDAARRAQPVITVTTLLSEHFSKQGAATLIVPPLIQPPPLRERGRFSSEGSPVHVAFAGSVGKKDEVTVRNMLIAAAELNVSRVRVVVHLVGPTYRECEKLLGTPLGRVPGVVLHGRQPHSLTAEIVQSCDYSVLQRPPRHRYAQAGFPTKVVESWMLGTPVLANITSDLAFYLDDGVNGLRISSESPGDLVATLLRAIDLRDSFDRASIRGKASADFSPAAHAGRVHDFLAVRHGS